MQAIKNRISKLCCINYRRVDDTDNNESHMTSYGEDKPEKLDKSETLSDFQVTLSCFQLKRDIERMLDIPRLMEMYGLDEEEPPLADMEVRNMSEFLERISEDYKKSSNGAKHLGVRRYELIDRRQGLRRFNRRFEI